MISQVIIMALFTLQYGVEELEAYVIIFIIFLLWTVISVSKKITDVDRWNLNSDVFVSRQRREIIFLGFPHKFFVLFYFYLKMNTFFWGAWIPWEKSHVVWRNLHRDVFVLRQRWEIISLGFQNEIICFIRVWKMVYQQLENAHFPLRSLISLKKITCRPNKSSQKCLWWGSGEKSFPFRTSFSFYSYLKKLFTSNLKMHIRKKRPTKTWNGL